MTDCNTKLRFVFGKNNRIEADFKGGDLSSDGGILVLRELEEPLKLIEGLSNCITDQLDAARIDSYSDETHGSQEQTYFHGFYNSYMYHPVMINEAKSGFPLVLQLRADNCHCGKGIKRILRWVFWHLKKAFPGVNIIMRGDSGFSLPEIISVCEKSEVQYVFGYARNAVLQRKIEFLS